jgi:peptidoglycan/LPS O-acetylase OafA/YrhL
MKHIQSLDGIRAVSFLLVFVAHTGLEKYVPGGLGVTIFFFLSGFLITTLMREEYAKSGALNLKHFWMRRALRILPPFYIVLIAAALVSPVALGPIRAQVFNVTNYWVMNHGYEGMPLGTGVYWSLSVEEHFYLLFPFAFIALQRLKRRDQLFILYGACALILAWRYVLVLHFHSITNRTYMGTDTRIDSIIFGCALAVWNVEKRRLIEWRWAIYAAAAAAVLGVCLTVRGEAFREGLRYTLQGLALTVLFIAAVRFPKWTPMRVLNTRILKFLGVLSYSLYLLHYAVIYAVQAAIPNVIVASVLAFFVSVGCSYIIYRLVEKPCANLRRSLETTPVMAPAPL